MSTVLNPKPDLPEQAVDPFRYGWRYVKTKGADGQIDFEQVPLTLEDVLHPEEGDFHVLNEWHTNTTGYLRSALKWRVKDQPDALVLSDHRIAWDIPGLRAHGPDIAVIFGVREWDPWQGTFDVAVMGVRPKLIIEVVSPDTRINDIVRKVRHYHKAQIPTYIIVDCVERARGIETVLLGYRYTPDGYVFMDSDEAGRLWLEAVNLWIELENHQISLRDDEGHKVGTYEEVEAGREAEKARAEAEKARADAAEQRAELEAAVRRNLEEQLKRMQDNLGSNANGPIANPPQS